MVVEKLVGNGREGGREGGDEASVLYDDNLITGEAGTVHRRTMWMLF